jgi:hypothetical protein
MKGFCRKQIGRKEKKGAKCIFHVSTNVTFMPYATPKSIAVE